MNYSKIKTDSYRLHLIQTDKFKKNTVKLCFRKPIIDFVEGLKRDILCNLLILGTKDYPTKRDLEIKCEELFGAHLSINNVKAGNYYIFSITISTLADKYTMENTTEQAIEFMKEVLYNPLLKNNLFNEKLVEMAKKMYIDDVKSIQDNPNQYSTIKMRYCTDKDSVYAFNPYFYLDEVNKITNEDLYNCYKQIFEESCLDIVTIGSFDEKIETYFKEINSKLLSSTVSIYPTIKKLEKQEVIEEGKYNQSKLSIACQLQNLTEFEKKYVMYIYSFILGGSSDSLIFKKLRQDNSLCYYADSSYILLYQMLEISAGIQSDNYEKAVVLIKEALEELKKGNFDEEEIVKAKVTYQNAWKEIVDSPNSIMNMYLSHEYYDLDLADTRIEEINKVTKEDIMNVANKLNISTIYLLKGMNEND